LSERGTKHVFPVNLAQIRSAATEIFDAQTKNEKDIDGAENRTLGYLRAVKKEIELECVPMPNVMATL